MAGRRGSRKYKQSRISSSSRNGTGMSSGRTCTCSMPFRMPPITATTAREIREMARYPHLTALGMTRSPRRLQVGDDTPLIETRHGTPNHPPLFPRKLPGYRLLRSRSPGPSSPGPTPGTVIRISGCSPSVMSIIVWTRASRTTLAKPSFGMVAAPGTIHPRNPSTTSPRGPDQPANHGDHASDCTVDSGQECLNDVGRFRSDGCCEGFALAGWM